MPTTILVAPAGRRRRPHDRLPRHRPRPRSPGHPRRLRQARSPTASRTTRSALLSLGAHFAIPPAVPRQVAEELLAAGDDQTLMEHVVEIAGQAGEDADVLIVEGMNPETGMVHATRVNALMLKALDAELVLVAAPRDQSRDRDGRRRRHRGPRLRRAVRGAAGRLHPEPGLHRRGGRRRRGRDRLGQAQGGCADCAGCRRPFAETRSGAPRGARGGEAPPARDRPVQHRTWRRRACWTWRTALKAQVLFAGRGRARGACRTWRSAR